MKTKIIPFNFEIAKKIQSGEIKGRILNNLKKEVRIVCFDREDAIAPIIALFKEDDGEGVMFVRKYGHAVNCRDILSLEVPEEEPQSPQPNSTHTTEQKPQMDLPYSIEQLVKLKDCTERLLKVNQGVIDDLNSMLQELKEICNQPLKQEPKSSDTLYRPSYRCTCCQLFDSPDTCCHHENFGIITKESLDKCVKHNLLREKLYGL